MDGSARAGPGPSTSLARLLELEARLETQLTEARARAEAMVRDAEERARLRMEALRQELTRAGVEAERRGAAEGEERLAALSRQNDIALARLRDVRPERIAELAHWVSVQVLDAAPGVEGA